MTHLSKEETAAQVLAVMQARFERPSLTDIEDILERAKQQARVSTPDGHPNAQPERAPTRLRIARRSEDI